MVYQTEKQIKDLGDKVPADVKSKVEAKVAELKETAAKDDTEATRRVIEELQKEVRSTAGPVSYCSSIYSLLCPHATTNEQLCLHSITSAAAYMRRFVNALAL